MEGPMIRKTVILCALALSATATARVSAQKIEGTYEFPQKIMTEPGSSPIDATGKLVLTVKGDSAFGTWQVPVPGRETKPMALKGTIKGSTVTLTSSVQTAHLRGQDGSNDRTFEVPQQYVLTITGDDITGEISAYTQDNSVELPTRSIKGRRAA
jgi:hypothetical protein